MRLYGKRFLHNSVADQVSDRRESRDGVLWDIYADQRFCRVKVAGSANLVKAFFPRNFDRTPVWLKEGTAVRIAHVGGSRSRIEVIGPGLVLPPPTSGEVIPAMPASPDSVISGMDLGATETAGGSVRIAEGTYRVSNTTYAFVAAPDMGHGGSWHMGDGGDMSGTYTIRAVDIVDKPTSEMWFRYDAFFVGVDGVLDYVKGTEWQYTGHLGSQTGPTRPPVPAGHVIVGNYILRWNGATVVKPADIGGIWEAPIPRSLSVEYGGGTPDIAWGGTDAKTIASMQKTFTVTVLDQYERPYSWWSSGSANEMEIQWLGSSSQSTGSMVSGAAMTPGQTTRTPLGIGSSFAGTMQRDYTYTAQGDPGQPGYPGYYTGSLNDRSPSLLFTLSSGSVQGVSNVVNIGYMNQSGQKMPVV